MDILKGNIVLLGLIFCLSGCKRYDVDEIERLFSLELEQDLEFVKIDEQWNDFNGDGEKVVVFNIGKLEAQKLFVRAKKQGFKEVNTNFSNGNFTRRELKYFRGNVIYQSLFMDNEVRTLVIDTLKGRVIYYYSIQ